MYESLGISHVGIHRNERSSCIAAGNSESLRIGQHHIVIYRNTRSRGRNLQAIRVLIRPGDTIVCTTPGYQSLRTRSPSHWVRPYALGMFARRMIHLCSIRTNRSYCRGILPCNDRDEFFTQPYGGTSTSEEWQRG